MSSRDAEEATRRTGTIAAALALAFAVLAAFVAAAPAQAEKRVALVIGNAAYKHAPALANPKNDAEGMAAALKRMGFEVLAGTDLDKPAMERLLRDFAQKIEKADVALVFYAGHGLQVNGRNYFVPVDSKLERESDLDFEAVPLELVQRVMEQGTRTNIIVLDACRDNPLARNLARSMGTRSAGIGRGLGQTQAGIGTLIVYATQPGNVALDGDKRNSPFTEALLKHIEAPGLEVRLVVSRVRQAVIEATKGKQVPWDSSSLVGEVYLAAKPAAPVAPETRPAPETKPPAPAATDTPRSPSPDQETVFWQSIQNSKSAADFKAYLERYPNGTFASLAKLRIGELEKSADATPPRPAPEAPKPAPMKPQRTSTYDVGIERTVGRVADANLANAASGEACRALCLREPRCLSWNYRTSAHPIESLRGVCALNWINPGASPNQASISGLIRTTPAAALVPPASPPPVTADGIFQELMRKAQARENGWAICARVPVDTRTGMDAKYERAKIGDVLVFRTAARQQCWASQILSDTVEDGKRCLRMQSYACYPAAPCAAAVVMRCKLASGQWELKK